VITFALKIFDMKKIFFIVSLFAASCTIAPRVTVSDTGNASSVVTDGKIYTTAYQQRAAEYRALCFQAFNIAHQRADEIVLTKTEKPKVIITDIDETVLDNSPYEAHQTLRGKGYESDSWYEWSGMLKADTVPGALSFLKYASSKGIEIFYVTNRAERERSFTLKNLQKFNFPNADSAHLFPLQNTSSKEVRRQNIAANHTIVMLMGDNLGDFSFLFDKKNSDERNQNVNELASEFGNRFIVLPNPVYGDWESSLYNYDYSLTSSQRDSIMKASLYSY
jgi:5'-nucleotidase (lipoprotein e(P4) family)